MYREISKNRVAAKRNRISFSWMGMILGTCLGIFLGCMFCPELPKIFSMGLLLGAAAGFLVD